MSIFGRFKKDPNGFRKLVELWESTPESRRKKMIEAGMKEDPEFTQKAGDYMLSIKDVVNLPDRELSEVIEKSPGRIMAVALFNASQEIKNRFIQNASPPKRSEIQEFLESSTPAPHEIGGAQIKLIETTRELEKEGIILTKKIPRNEDIL